MFQRDSQRVLLEKEGISMSNYGNINLLIWEQAYGLGDRTDRLAFAKWLHEQAANIEDVERQPDGRGME